jgi:hypothetical protein
VLTVIAGNGGIASASGAVPANKWTHIAVTRSGTTVRVFVNGTQTATQTGNATSIGGAVTIGGYGGGSNAFPGYISNLRLVKGTSLYTSNFTPSVAPLTAITNTTLLTCQSNRYIDNSSNGLAVTPNTPANMSVLSFSPFSPTGAYSAVANGGSMYVGGSDYVTLPANSNYALGSGNFTIEAWLWPKGAQGSSAGILDIDAGNGTNYVQFGYDGTTLFGLAMTGAWQVTGAIPVVNTWNHVAITRVGSTLTYYLNGVNVGTVSGNTSTPTTPTGLTYVGSFTGSNSFAGYISDVRLVVGTAVYTTGFTPPVAPLTAVTNTKLLMNFTNGGIVDAASKSDLIGGTAVIDTTTVKYGTGSIKFTTATTSYLTTTQYSAFEFRTGDYTIEFWYNATSLPANWYILDQTTPSVQTAFRGATTTLNYSYASGTTTNLSTTLTTGVWNHFAVSRNSGTLRTFFNGNLVSTISNSTDIAIPTNLAIGASVATNSNNSNGYLDDFRVTKGVGRYTASFTPPTAGFPVQ